MIKIEEVKEKIEEIEKRMKTAMEEKDVEKFNKLAFTIDKIGRILEENLQEKEEIIERE